VQILEETYCRSIGFEIMHVASEEERQWLLERVESVRGRIELTKQAQDACSGAVAEREEFENFLQKRYPGDKRFSLEGLRKHHRRCSIT
jgi:2-oxoglutarate dehydrogenase E1 component